MPEGTVPFLVQFGETAAVPPAPAYEQDDVGMLHLAGSGVPAIADVRCSPGRLATMLTKAKPDPADPDLVRGLLGRNASLMAELVTDVVTVAPDPDVIRFDAAVRAIRQFP